jgi:hypothetical protein
MSFATFPNEGEDDLVARAEDDQWREARQADSYWFRHDSQRARMEMTNSWLVQKPTSDEKRVRQTLMCFATFPNEGDDDLVASAENGQ